MPTRGPQGGPVVFTYTGLLAMIKAVMALQAKVNAPEMDRVVRRAAEPWRDNYDGEGFAVGGWPILSQFTQNVRHARGYPAAHPILVQGGGLRRAAVQYPLEFTGKNVSRITSPTRGGNSGPTNITIRTSASGRAHRAELKISGEKVKHQTGGGVGQPVGEGIYVHSLPPRRFWFVNNEVREKMTEAALEGVQPEMDRLGGHS